MNRNAKALQKKAKKNTVQPEGRGRFTVTSSTSDESYLVCELANDGFACCCKWATYHRTDYEPCSHVLTVIEYLEQAGGRAASFWGSTQDAERQHRPIERVGRRLWATKRSDGFRKAFG